jgi:hypothetical protein
MASPVSCRPAATSGEFEPLLVSDRFVGGYAVVLCQRDQPQPGGSEQCRDLDAAQASIKE